MFEFTKKAPLSDLQLTYSSTIGEGSVIVGNFSHLGNLLLSGHLIGDIFEEHPQLPGSTESTVVIGRSGFLEGDIHTSHAVIVGRIEGSVFASGRVEIYPGAIVLGDVTYGQLNVHPGAKVNGTLKCLLEDGILVQASEDQGNTEDVTMNVLPMVKAESQ